MPQPKPLATIDDVRLMTLKSFSEPNGSLVPVTSSRDLPFEIQRVFYVFSVAGGSTRGEHAHVTCQQALVCVNGACEVSFEDGSRRSTLTLSRPDQALYVPPSLWTTQRYLKKDSVLVVFTNQPYDEKDYIRNYDDYLTFRGISLPKVAAAR